MIFLSADDNQFLSSVVTRTLHNQPEIFFFFLSADDNKILSPDVTRIFKFLSNCGMTSPSLFFVFTRYFSNFENFETTGDSSKKNTKISSRKILEDKIRVPHIINIICFMDFNALTFSSFYVRFNVHSVSSR